MSKRMCKFVLALTVIGSMGITSAANAILMSPPPASIATCLQAYKQCRLDCLYYTNEQQKRECIARCDATKRECFGET